MRTVDKASHCAETVGEQRCRRRLGVGRVDCRWTQRSDPQRKEQAGVNTRLQMGKIFLSTISPSKEDKSTLLERGLAMHYYTTLFNSLLLLQFHSFKKLTPPARRALLQSPFSYPRRLSPGAFADPRDHGITLHHTHTMSRKQGRFPFRQH